MDMLLRENRCQLLDAHMICHMPLFKLTLTLTRLHTGIDKYFNHSNTVYVDIFLNTLTLHSR